MPKPSKNTPPKNDANTQGEQTSNVPVVQEKHSVEIETSNEGFDIGKFTDSLSNAPSGRLPLNSTFLGIEEFVVDVEEIFGFIKMDKHVDSESGEEMDAVILLNKAGEIKKTTSSKIVTCCRSLVPFDNVNMSRLAITYKGKIQHPKKPSRKINDFVCKLVG